MYTNSSLNPIDDRAQYIASDGTKYPGNYPKVEITELHKVTEVAQSTDAALFTTGFIIDNTFTQIWQTRIKTPEELAADKKAEVPDLATQLAAALINKGVIVTEDLNPTTIEVVNDKLSTAGLSVVGISHLGRSNLIGN